jgi:hypothetical protein
LTTSRRAFRLTRSAGKTPRECRENRLGVELDGSHIVAASERCVMMVVREGEILDAGVPVTDRRQRPDRLLELLPSHQQVDVADHAHGGIAIEVGDQIGDALEQHRLDPDRIEHGDDVLQLIGDPAVALAVELVHRFQVAPHLGGQTVEQALVGEALVENGRDEVPARELDHALPRERAAAEVLAQRADGLCVKRAESPAEKREVSLPVHRATRITALTSRPERELRHQAAGSRRRVRSLSTPVGKPASPTYLNLRTSQAGQAANRGWKMSICLSAEHRRCRSAAVCP